MGCEMDYVRGPLHDVVWWRHCTLFPRHLLVEWPDLFVCLSTEIVEQTLIWRQVLHLLDYLRRSPPDVRLQPHNGLPMVRLESFLSTSKAEQEYRHVLLCLIFA